MSKELLNEGIALNGSTCQRCDCHSPDDAVELLQSCATICTSKELKVEYLRNRVGDGLAIGDLPFGGVYSLHRL